VPSWQPLSLPFCHNLTEPVQERFRYAVTEADADMAQSGAARQAVYRQRRAMAGDNGERRINTWVATGAALTLARVARHHGVSQREILERPPRPLDYSLPARYSSPKYN
jgi:hypothetical protein